MKIFSDINIGDKLEIEIENYEDEKNGELIFSQLVDIDNSHLHISMPIQKAIPFPLHRGQTINVIFYHSEKGIFRLKCKVIKQIKSNVAIYVLKPLKEAEKIQRRNHYRLSTVKKVIIEKDEDHELQGVTKDLSGGGMKVITGEKLEEGSTINFRIYLDAEKEPLKIEGKVLRSIKDSVTMEWETAIEFEPLKHNIENKIISFIFEKQRILRKKGLI